MEKCCSECPDPRVGQSLCTGCNKWLCFQCTDLHQHERSPGPMAEQQQQRPGSPPPPPPPPPPPSETGSGCRGHAVVMCSLHKQEALELFCETCDLMACSICLLSTHKDHRLVHVGKAMQDQRWLLESLLARVEEKRSAVETTAKQIQDRLHGVRNTQRKAENQIKMAKMIMMNELNKRANLLIEQLESISSDFKQRLEDHLQGAIELCSQLDHMQNFITWATAHHRRNPLLFSKDLIALQLQRLLEPLMHTDSWVPLKIKFNWDASYWTKQISTLGQLTVAGGSRPYSEGMGRTGILRPVPQPVPCLSVPALCPAVREQGCAAYQAFCQPQICCLHCVVPQTTSLPALQPGKPTCPGRCSQTRCPWEAEGVAPPRPFPPSAAQQQRLQNPIALPSGDSAQLSPSGAPSRQTTADPCQRDGEANGSEQPGADGGSREKLRSETQTPQKVLEPERRVSSEQVLVQLHCPPSQTAGTGSDPWPQQAPTGPRLSDTSRVDGRPSALELRTVDQGSGEGHSESAGDMKARTQSCPAEPQRTSPPERPAKDKPSGTGRSLSTAMEQERTALQPEQYELREKGMQPVRRMSRGLPNVSCPPTQSQASQPTYKTEPDNICVYTRKNSRLKHRKKYKISRNVYSREASKSSEGSKVPVVCLERLKILVSRLPPQGRAQMGLPADSELKSERAVTQKLERDLHAERVSTEELLQVDESRFLSSSQLPSEKLHGISSPSSPASPAPPERESLNHPYSTPPPQSTDPEGTDTEQEAPSDPRSVPTSESLPESTTETDPGSEAEVDSEVQPESDLSFESEPQAEGDSDSDLESERRGGAELSTPSESSFRSEAGSMAEVTVRVNSGSELEAGEETAQAAVKAGSEVACERVTEGQASAEPAEEMESEDFCAVCLIGGELLCCDRCPKVYHLSCHIPSLLRFPTGDWVCSLCRGYQQPVAERDFESGQPTTPASPYGLSACEQRKCEKLTLLILSNILSAPFHEPVSPLARHYYQIIKKPMDLSVIRSKLSQASTTHYNSPEEFVADVLLMFKNCAKFNYPDSEVAQAGRSLEVFFSSKLREVFPEHSFPALQEDSDSEEYEEVPRGSEEGFLWPERKEQGHRKRKRRHSHNPRKNYF